MPIPLLATPGLPELLGLGYVAAGLGIALKLERRQLSRSTVLSALVCWPLYLGLLTDSGPPPPPTGPLAARIRQAFEALAAAELDLGEVDDLRRTLEAADRRLAKVDALLAEDLGYTGEAYGRLQQARARTAAEIEGVIDGVLELRIQVGLVELAGDTAPITERLRELRGRVEALEEIGAL